MTHSALSNSLSHTSGEVVNGLDDNNDGYVDNVAGYDFVRENAGIVDQFGHGTHVAGYRSLTQDSWLGTARTQGFMPRQRTESWLLLGLLISLESPHRSTLRGLYTMRSIMMWMSSTVHGAAAVSPKLSRTHSKLHICMGLQYSRPLETMDPATILPVPQKSQKTLLA
jgi:hypothetical protein